MELLAPKQWLSGVANHPTWEVADVLERLIPELQKRRSIQARAVLNEDGDEVGALQMIAERTAASTGRTEAATLRRLWGIRHRESTMTNAELAEAIFDALGTSPMLEDIPYFPASRREAQEMVEIYHELRGQTPTWDEQIELAISLENFCKGYCFFDAELVEEEALIAA